MRLLSYNVRSLRNSPSGVAAVIRAGTPDVVCVQEAPRWPVLWRWHARRLARAAGLVVVTGGRPAAAMLLLARPEVRVVVRRNVKFPWRPPRHRRGLAMAVVEVAGRRVAVASMHLSLDAAERVAQAHRIVALLGGLGVPAVVAGDVNETPGGPAWAVLGAVFQDAYAVAPDGPGDTFPAGRPRRRIDAVFADPRVGVVGCGVLAADRIETASDHRPVLATLKVGYPTETGG